MRRGLLASTISAMALGLCAGPALASEAVGGQLAEQVAGSKQTAVSNANSTQINPTNTNISVRVLSPGNDGNVTQTNESAAHSFAGNANDTAQTVSQAQGGAGGVGIQEAAQKAGSLQHADSNAESTQYHPTNRTISVRVLSDGDGGNVSQSNESTAKSFAGNHNKLEQDVSQDQGGGGCCVPVRKADSGCCTYHQGGGVGIQAAGQEAYSRQKAESNAESKQVKPTNTNLSVRVLSPGHDGDVEQSNSSKALSGALNKNDTSQSIDQTQSGGGCGPCAHGIGIQAAGQRAYNDQWADSNAESKQYHPLNKALSVRFLSYGGGGGLSQSNSSYAGSLAANWNALDQSLTQRQGG